MSHTLAWLSTYGGCPRWSGWWRGRGRCSRPPPPPATSHIPAALRCCRVAAHCTALPCNPTPHLGMRWAAGTECRPVTRLLLLLPPHNPILPAWSAVPTDLQMQHCALPRLVSIREGGMLKIPTKAAIFESKEKEDKSQHHQLYSLTSCRYLSKNIGEITRICEDDLCSCSPGFSVFSCAATL